MVLIYKVIKSHLLAISSPSLFV